jgi:hypothetical protein
MECAGPSAIDVIGPELQGDSEGEARIVLMKKKESIVRLHRERRFAHSGVKMEPGNVHLPQWSIVFPGGIFSCARQCSGRADHHPERPVPVAGEFFKLWEKNKFSSISQSPVSIPAPRSNERLL